MDIKTVTSSELRTNVKQVLNEVEYGAERYIIEKFGAPTAAIISIEDFQFFQAIRAILEEAERKDSDEAQHRAISSSNMRDTDASHREAPLVETQGEPSNANADEVPLIPRNSLTREEQVESVMQMLKDSENIPEIAKNYMQNDLIYKLLVTVQYLEAEVSRLEEKMGIKTEQTLANEKTMEQMSGPYSEHWGKFVGAFSGEEWERPEQGTLEVREAW